MAPRTRAQLRDIALARHVDAHRKSMVALQRARAARDAVLRYHRRFQRKNDWPRLIVPYRENDVVAACLRAVRIHAAALVAARRACFPQ
jgi:hypothetical protein